MSMGLNVSMMNAPTQMMSSVSMAHPKIPFSTNAATTNTTATTLLVFDIVFAFIYIPRMSDKIPIKDKPATGDPITDTDATRYGLKPAHAPNAPTRTAESPQTTV